MKMLQVFVASYLAATIFHADATEINSGAFVLTGAMSTERSLHTATLLADGRVLVVGGVNAAGEALDSAEIYDPGSGEFTLIAGILGTARFGSAATRLLDGRVLIVGGEDSSHTSIDSVEIFDLSTGMFSSTGSLGTSRLNPTVTLLESTGQVLVVGGYEGTSDGTPLATAELYDPVTGAFAATGSMTTARRNHTATTLSNSTILIAGGYNGSNVNAPEIYDPATSKFTTTSSMSAARRYPTATLLQDNTVLLAGGYDNGIEAGTTVVLGSAELAASEGQSFTDTEGNLLTPRGRHTATLLGDGTVLIAGGYDEAAIPLDSAERYDPVTGKFFATEAMSTGRWRHTETLLNDGSVLIIGGAGPGGALSSAELYTVVPEPSTAMLVLAGLAGCFLRRRHRRGAIRSGTRGVLRN